MENNEKESDSFTNELNVQSESSIAGAEPLDINVDSFINFNQIEISKTVSPTSNETKTNDSSLNTLENIISSISNNNNNVEEVIREETSLAQQENVNLDEVQIETSIETAQTVQQVMPSNQDIEIDLPNDKSKDMNVDKFLRLNELIEKSLIVDEKEYKIRKETNATDSDVIVEEEDQSLGNKFKETTNSGILNCMTEATACNSKIRFRQVKVTRLIHQTTTFVFREVLDRLDNAELECSLDSTKKEKEVIDERTECRFLTQKEIIESCLNKNSTKTKTIQSHTIKNLSKSSHLNLDKLQNGKTPKKSYPYADRVDTSSESSDDEPLFIAKPKSKDSIIYSSTRPSKKVRSTNSLSVGKVYESSSSLSSIEQLICKRKKTSKLIPLSDSESESHVILNKKIIDASKKRKLFRRKARPANFIDFKKYKIDLSNSPSPLKKSLRSANSTDLNGVNLPFLKECSVKLKRIDIRDHTIKDKPACSSSSKLPIRNSIRLRNSLKRAYN